MLFFICGPHTAGKTSIIKRLKDENIVPLIGTEIGKQLFYQRKFHPQMQKENFELDVMGHELARDRFFIKNNTVAVIETWHPGNVAYAAVRNPGIVPQMVAKLNSLQYLKDSYGIYLTIDSETIKRRTKTFKDNSDWAADFYSKINKEIEKSIVLLNLASNTIKIDASTNFDVVYENVKAAVLKIINSPF